LHQLDVNLSNKVQPKGLDFKKIKLKVYLLDNFATNPNQNGVIMM
jgi:hypothetical protein